MPTGSNHPSRLSVDEALARTDGVKPGTWHARRFGRHAVNGQFVAIVRELKRRGAWTELEEWAREAIAELESIAPEMCAAEAERLADEADAIEDVHHARYRAERSKEAARALIRARATERRTSLVHDLTLARDHGLTP